MQGDLTRACKWHLFFPFRAILSEGSKMEAPLLAEGEGLLACFGETSFNMLCFAPPLAPPRHMSGG